MIEIGNSGEVFLNPDLPAILRYAHEKGVTIRIAEGANLNDAADEALEALVNTASCFKGRHRRGNPGDVPDIPGGRGLEEGAEKRAADQ